MTPIQTDIIMTSIAASADLASTKYAQRIASNYEANPLMREPAQAILIKAASVTLTIYSCEQLRKHNHPK